MARSSVKFVTEKRRSELRGRAKASGKHAWVGRLARRGLIGGRAGIAMLRFACPHCGAALKAPEEKHGGVMACPACRQQFKVPTPDPQVETAMFDDTGGVRQTSPRLRSFPMAPYLRRMPGWVKWCVLPGALAGLILLIVAIVLVGSGKSKPENMIVGHWHSLDDSGPSEGPVVFNKDGTAYFPDHSFIGRGSYYFVSDKRVLLRGRRVTVEFSIVFHSNDEMTLFPEMEDGRPSRAGAMHFKRAK